MCGLVCLHLGGSAQEGLSPPSAAGSLARRACVGLAQYVFLLTGTSLCSEVVLLTLRQTSFRFFPAAAAGCRFKKTASSFQVSPLLLDYNLDHQMVDAYSEALVVDNGSGLCKVRLS